MQNSIDRRAFVETLLLLPAGLFLVRCGSNSTPTPAGTPSVIGAQATYTSSTTEGHHHTFSIQIADFENPPSGGVSGRTSTALEHTHTVSVSMEQLANVQAGQSVTITTSSTLAHTHTFTFVKVAERDGGFVVP